jgi:hypothetical protein
VGDKPPFNPQRAAFILVCAVLAFQGAVILMGLGTCMIELSWHLEATITGTRGKCDPDNRLLDLLTSALTAALGYAAGMTQRGPPKD